MKNFIFTFFVYAFLLLPFQSKAQLINSTKSSSNEIEGLSIFPNPVTTDKLYITTKSKLPKIIEIYDVLGKRIIAVSILGESLNISRLAPGIYIIKIKENQLSATRKLVVR